MNIKYGTFLPRFFAYLFDGLLLGLIPLFLMLLAVSYSQTTQTFWINIFWILIEVCLFQYFIDALYRIYTYIVFRGSIGKILAGLYIEKEDGTNPNLVDAIIRFPVGYLVSTFAFYLGFLWIIKDKKNQAFHDHFAGTVVIKKHSGVFIFPALVLLFIICAILICMIIKIGGERQLWQSLVTDFQSFIDSLRHAPSPKIPDSLPPNIPNTAI